MNLYYPSSLFAFYIALFISIYIYLSNPKKKLNITYSLLVLSVAFGIFGDLVHYTFLINYASELIF